MTTALPADQFTWLPASMREAGRRHGFGQRYDADLRLVRYSGSLWASDGGAIVDSGEPAVDETSRARATLAGLIIWPDMVEAEPRRIGDRVCIGAAVINAAYYDLVLEMYPGATWEVEPDQPLAHVVARVGEKAVAVVMPLRSSNG